MFTCENAYDKSDYIPFKGKHWQLLISMYYPRYERIQMQGVLEEIVAFEASQCMLQILLNPHTPSSLDASNAEA